MLRREQSAPPLSLDVIGTGALSLQSTQKRGWIARVVECISISGITTRPDVAKRKIRMVVGSKTVIVESGQFLYLREEAQGHGLQWSEEPTQFWVKPIFLDGDEVLIEVGRTLAMGTEKGEYIAHVAPAVMRNAEALDHLLLNARYLGRDELYERFGKGRKENKKLLFTEGGKSYALFVSPGDFVQYTREKWRISHESLDPTSPLMVVQEVQPDGILLQGWDCTGIGSSFFHIPEETSSIPPQRDLLPASAQITPTGLILCRLGSRQFVLREGDWLLHTSGNWRYIRRGSDRKKALEHQWKGILFVCDRVEKTKKGMVMQGTLFNELRTSYQCISLPLEEMKKRKR